ncbi:unnamed protein product [Citrullus colocynthis]|uniref:Uncharacterized protein n=1 Tax=Citrullus colocynthis TaxID=252529 RepID=A0ABP0XUB1_9ROSI
MILNNYHISTLISLRFLARGRGTLNSGIRICAPSKEKILFSNSHLLFSYSLSHQFPTSLNLVPVITAPQLMS